MQNANATPYVSVTNCRSMQIKIMYKAAHMARNSGGAWQNLAEPIATDGFDLYASLPQRRGSLKSVQKGQARKLRTSTKTKQNKLNLCYQAFAEPITEDSNAAVSRQSQRTAHHSYHNHFLQKPITEDSTAANSASRKGPQL